LCRLGGNEKKGAKTTDRADRLYAKENDKIVFISKKKAGNGSTNWSVGPEGGEARNRLETSKKLTQKNHEKKTSQGGLTRHENHAG